MRLQPCALNPPLTPHPVPPREDPQTPDRPAANRKATVWVREGDVLEAVVRTFMAGREGRVLS